MPRILQRGGSCYGLLDISNAQRNQANTGGPVPTGQLPTGPIPTGQIPTGPVPTGPVPRGQLPADVIAKAQEALIPINENTTVADIILAPMAGYYEVTKQRTMGNGDCMYSSIYRAANARREFRCVIDEVLGHGSPDPPNLVAMSRLVAESEEEMRFVQNARTIVALYGVDRFNNFYDIMLNNYKNNREAYEGIIRGGTLDSKLIQIMEQHIVNRPNEDNFVNAYIENTLNLDASGNIPNPRSYSGEIEYDVIEQFIKERCNIDIDVKMSESNTVRIQVKPNTLYIENQGGGHYEYFKIGRPIDQYQPNDNEITLRLVNFFNPKITRDMIMFLLQNNDKVRAINEILRISDTVPKGLGDRRGIITNHNYGDEYVQLKAATANWLQRQRQKGGKRKSASKSEMGCGCGLKLSGGRRKTRRSKKVRKTRKARKTRK
jgi:hypothetical protein